MNIRINDYFELAEKKYITLDVYEYENNKYIFVNELDDEEEPKQNFKVFRCMEQGLVEEKKEEVLKEVLKVFEKNFNEKIREYVNATELED